jgi:predicted methyltransferase
MRPILILCALAITGLGASATAVAVDQPATTTRATSTDTVQQAVAGSWRDPKNIARDRYRHPVETLAFFGVKPTQTVIEITPGSGWYSEILGPLLRAHGHYIAAVPDPMVVEAGRSRDSRQKAKSSLEAKFAAAPAQLDQAQVVAYDPAAPKFGAPGSADVVLTFRNVHNWRSAKQADGMFRGFFEVLKPGGTLGVVEHRAASDVADGDKSGYVGEQQVIAMAKAAGFRLDAKSEANANPKDTKDYPGGVWTLPPTNDHDAKDEAKYQAIGESDRMTLRFVKP